MTHHTEQPEALRLVEWFEEGGGFQQGTKAPHKWVLQAEQELRRLHAESELHQQELAAYRFTVENSQARVTGLDEAQLAAEQRVPLSVVDAIKQGLQADEATRHHCRGTTNWAAAMTRFYERAHGITQEKQG